MIDKKFALAIISSLIILIIFAVFAYKFFGAKDVLPEEKPAAVNEIKLPPAPPEYISINKHIGNLLVAKKIKEAAVDYGEVAELTWNSAGAEKVFTGRVEISAHWQDFLSNPNIRLVSIGNYRLDTAGGSLEVSYEDGSGKEKKVINNKINFKLGADGKIESEEWEMIK
jgi:hypothetical protein